MGSQKFRPKIQKTKNGEKWKMPISRVIFEAVGPMWPPNFFDPKNSGLRDLSILYNIGPIRARESLQKRPSKWPKTPSWVVAHEKFSDFKIAHISITSDLTHQFYWRNRLNSSWFTRICNKIGGVAGSNRLKSGPKKCQKIHKNLKIFLTSLGLKIVHILITFLPTPTIFSHIRAIQAPILPNITKNHTTW